MYVCLVGRDSIFLIATRYGLDGPRIESRLWLGFPHSSIRPLGPPQPLIQGGPGNWGGGGAPPSSAEAKGLCLRDGLYGNLFTLIG